MTTRIAIPVFGIFAVVVAIKIRVVYDLILDSNSIILVCVTVPFIAGVWWKKSQSFGSRGGHVGLPYHYVDRDILDAENGSSTACEK